MRGSAVGRVNWPNAALTSATANWLADQRAQWESRTDRLEAYVATLMKDTKA